MTADRISQDLAPSTVKYTPVFLSGCCMPGVWIKDAGYSPFVKNVEDKAILSLNLDRIESIDSLLDVERLLKAYKGLYSANVNVTQKVATVAWHVEKPIDIEKLLTFLASKQYTAVPFVSDTKGNALEKNLLRALVVSIFGAINVMMLSISVWAGNVQDMMDSTRTLFHFISAILTIPIAAYASIPFFKGALYHIKNRQTGMDIPIASAVVLSIILSLIQTFKQATVTYFDSTLMLIVFLLLGRYLDVRARRQAQDSALRLLSLQTPVVQYLHKSRPIVVPIKDIKKGDTILVLAGEKIPLDGIIEHGTSSLDTSMMTGESLPTYVKKGDTVLAGTTNTSGILHIRVTNTVHNTTLTKMIELLKKTQSYRNTYTRFADKVAKFYTPFIYISALATYIYHATFSDNRLDSLTISLSVLIIACPCALAIAVPGVQAISTGKLFTKGILVKNGSALERLCKANTFVFDKTGTLTEGTFTVKAHKYKQEDLRIACGLAQYSNHPLCVSLQGVYKNPPPFSDVEEIAGTGIRGRYKGQLYTLGKADFVGKKHCDTVYDTHMWLKYPDSHTVCFTFTDTIKNAMPAVLRYIKAEGHTVIILSGDVRKSVESVAKKLCIDTVYWSKSPLEKVRTIKQLQSQGRNICMVGDGTNDAPALHVSNVSITPNDGSDMAKSMGDFVLKSKNLQAIICLMQTAKKAQRIMLQNIVFSLLYNIVAVPVAFMGFVTPLVAVISMSLSSLIVVGNALRLRNDIER